MAKFQLECVGCSNLYEYDNSTASSEEARTIYCSGECEGEEMQRLTEGNNIIATALAINPLAFAKTLTNLTPKEKLPLELDKIDQTVDRVFDHFGFKR